MPKTFTATAQPGINNSMGWAEYGSSHWEMGADAGAYQGTWHSTSASASRVGIMVFSGAAAVLNKKRIKQITLTITEGGAGSGASRTLTFCKSPKDTYDGGKGSSYVGAQLGTLTDVFMNNTTTHTLSSTSNTEFFNAFAAYLSEGHEILVLYNGETGTSSSWSRNFKKLTKVVLSVEYIGDGTVWYNNGGQIVECAVFYNNGGNISQVVPYYCNGGTIVEV